MIGMIPEDSPRVHEMQVVSAGRSFGGAPPPSPPGRQIFASKSSVGAPRQHFVDNRAVFRNGPKHPKHPTNGYVSTRASEISHNGPKQPQMIS